MKALILALSLLAIYAQGTKKFVQNVTVEYDRFADRTSNSVNFPLDW